MNCFSFELCVQSDLVNVQQKGHKPKIWSIAAAWTHENETAVLHQESEYLIEILLLVNLSVHRYQVHVQAHDSQMSQLLFFITEECICS